MSVIKNDIEKAISIAAAAHHGCTDKHNNPYILHPLRVMMSLEDDKKAMILGVLHDVIEVADVPIDYLTKVFDNKEIISSLICLTKLPNESYESYIQRVSKNSLARKVKLADLKDNLFSDNKLDSSDLDKYIKAYIFLKDNEI